MIRVWGRRSSINVQKVLWAVGELGLPVERETVGGSFGGTAEPAFRAMNPNGLVPVVQDGDVTMFESNAIVRFLAARYGHGTLRPNEPLALAAAEQWMEWQQTTVYPHVAAIFWNTVRLGPDQRDAKAIEAAEARLFEVLPMADALIGRQPWFAGQAFSFGDIVIGALLWRYAALACRKPETPHLAGWLEKLKAREPYRRWIMVPVGANPQEWHRNERELA